MTPEQLKLSILQYAIQGKLVEQRPEEGNAEELYEQIVEEKNRLINEGKIKKEKELSDIKEDEKLFDIPENWKWVRVGDVGSWAAGSTPSRTNLEFYNGTIPWLKTGDLNDGYIDDVSEYITELAVEKTTVRVNPVGSVLMAMYGATIGKLGILSKAMTTNQACCACIPYDGIYNKYLFYFLMAQRRSYIKMADGGAQPNISKKKIINSIMPLPPLKEQYRIVTKIRKILQLVDQYAISWKKLDQLNAEFPEKMKKSILQYAIQGKLVEQRPEEGTAEDLYEQIKEEKNKLIKEGKIKKEKALAKIIEDEIPFDIPSTWKWVRLKDIVFNHGQKKPENTFSYIDIGSINNKNQKLNEKEKLIIADKAPSRARKIVKDGDIIYSTVRPYLHNMCIIDKKFQAEPIASTGFAVLSCYKGINNKYLFYYLLSPEFDNYANSKENAKGITYPAINDKKLYNAIVPLPPYEEQKRIVQRIEKIIPYCQKLIK